METSAGARTRVRWRLAAAALTTLVVLAMALVFGLLSTPDGGTPVIFVSRLSSAIGDLATRAGGGAWWIYAFLLGAVAAFNPCGFALLPAYLGLYLRDLDSGSSLAARAGRSLSVAAAVAVAFTALFGAMGAVGSHPLGPRCSGRNNVGRHAAKRVHKWNSL